MYRFSSFISLVIELRAGLKHTKAKEVMRFYRVMDPLTFLLHPLIN
jgi:hypothetical protein